MGNVTALPVSLLSVLIPAIPALQVCYSECKKPKLYPFLSTLSLTWIFGLFLSVSSFWRTGKGWFWRNIIFGGFRRRCSNHGSGLHSYRQLQQMVYWIRANEPCGVSGLDGNTLTFMGLFFGDHDSCRNQETMTLLSTQESSPEQVVGEAFFFGSHNHLFMYYAGEAQLYHIYM